MAASWSTYLTRSDGVLLLLAVAGVLAYVLWLPQQHPDAAAAYDLSPLQVQEAAEAFLARHGYAVDNLEADVEMRRNPDRLLDSLQASVGRHETVRLLRSEVREVLPAYYWRVRYYQRAEDGDDEEIGEGQQGQADRYLIYLTLSGSVWAFQNETPPPAPGEPVQVHLLRHVDRDALQLLWSGEDGRIPPMGIELDAASDTLLAQSLFFDFAPPFGADSLRRPPPDGGGRGGRDRGRPGRRPLAQADAEALARYHLDRTLAQAGPFRADSVWALAERGGRIARVRFVTAEPVHGQHLRADVGVSAVGALQGLDMHFNSPSQGVEPTESIVAEVTRGSIYLIFVITLLVIFFRRLVQRLIDVKAALVDGGVLGVLFIIGAAMNLGVDPINVQASQDWIVILGMLIMLSIIASIVALFTFLLSGAADSVARAVWPEKLLTTSLVRQGTFRNGYVGASLLRGLCLAGLLLGGMTLVLAVLPQASLRLDRGPLLPSAWLQPMVGVATFYGAAIYVTLLMLLLGGGTFFYRLTGKRAAVMVGLVALVAAPLQSGLALLGPLAYEWGVSAVFGGVVAWMFWKYDLLTCFVGLFVALLFWKLSEGWLIAGSPAWLDMALASVLTVGIGAVGFVGVVGARRGVDVAEYTPSYIRELTRQERMQRELEIAHQVQESFLPRRMPQMAGVEIAAMCLAAQDVGGDYYDFVELGDGRLGVAVGDVSGKGIQAAFYMTLTKGFLQTLCRDLASPAEVLRRLNGLFYENAPRGTFISMIYGVLDVHERTFTFARAGHNPVILKRSPSQVPDLVQPAGMAIGLTAGPRFDTSIEETTLHLRTGDVLVLYTDGFSEATNMAREQYGDARLARKVGDVGQRSASEVLRGVTEDVHRFIEAAGRHDDMTMVVMKLAGRPSVKAAQPAGAYAAQEQPST